MKGYFYQIKKCPTRKRRNKGIQLDENDNYYYVQQLEMNEEHIGNVPSHMYLTQKQGFDLRKSGKNDMFDTYMAKKVIVDANKAIRQEKKTYKLIGSSNKPIQAHISKNEIGPLKPPILISHQSRNRVVYNFQKFELQHKVDLSGEGDINYWEIYDLRKAECRLQKILKIQKYFYSILENFSSDMNLNVILTEEHSKYFQEKQFSMRQFLAKVNSDSKQFKFRK